MVLKVVGAGVGRTGTYSLKLALEQLGFGPCHHMEEVLKDAPRQVPLWSAAAEGKPDWEAIFHGYNATVDWPSAGFWRELAAVYPAAKVILTTRNAERWYQSYAETIAKIMSAPDQMPPHLKPWLDMATAVMRRSGLGGKTNRTDIIRAFEAHLDAVRTSIPANRLLVYEVKDGWEPLCSFLGVPVPSAPFPNTNNTEEFWELVRRGMG
jgi:sulfotransferase family protein